MSREEYIDALEAVEILIQETRPTRWSVAKPIIHEMKLAAYFNAKFRETTRDELQDLIDELYVESQAILPP